MKSFFRQTLPFFIMIFAVPIFVLRAQSNQLRLYEQDEIRQLKKIAESSSEGTFIQALFETDAAKAIASMKELIQKDPQNDFLPAVLERVAQYQFATGLYNTARNTFEYLAENYRNTPFGENAFFYTARCLQAIGRTDSSQLMLQEFLSRYPRSRYSEIALQEIKAGVTDLSQSADQQPSDSEKIANVPTFSIQTGAFSTDSNANIQKQFLEDKGLQAAIYPKWVDQKKYFVVCIGRFESREEAQRYGDEIAGKYKLNYQIINLQDVETIQ